jgi:hypothetical protein
MKLQPSQSRVVGRFVLTLALAATAPAWAEPEDEPALAPIIVEARQAFWWGDFAALEKQNAYFRQPGRFGPDGTSDLDLFRTGLRKIFDSKVKPVEPYLQELEAVTLQWATEHPKSALAHIMHANALVAHAWSYRGGGFANTVPPEAWRDFHAYLGRALDYLKSNADVALTDSYAHTTLLVIGRGLGWDAKQMGAVAQDGLKRNPQDINLYFEMMTTLLPKWGGNAKTLDDYIRQTAEQTRADYGLGMYARLYSAAAEEHYGHALFEDSHADWARMKQGYEDMQVRYPDSPGRRNRYAYMACLAKDRTTLLALLDELGPKLDATKWGDNPERSLESCQRWARQV